MNSKQKEYMEYIERVQRVDKRPIEVLSQHSAIREVGKSYGLTLQECEQVVIDYVREKGVK